MKKFLSVLIAFVFVFSAVPVASLAETEFCEFSVSVFAASKPSKVKLSSVSNVSNGVKIKWSKVSGATSYTVYRKTSSNSWKKLGTTKSLSYTDKTAKSGTTYKYTVSAKNKAGSGAYDKTGLSIYYLAAPTVTVSNSSNGIKVNWSKIKGAKGYVVYRKLSSDSKWTKLKKINGNTKVSFADESVLSGKTYQYMVKAYNGKKYSSYKTSSSLLYLEMPLPSVSNKSQGVFVKWSKISGAKGYIVYRKAKGDSSWTKIATLSSSSVKSFIDTNVKINTYYKYTVKAYSGKYYSAYCSGAGITFKGVSTDNGTWDTAKCFNFYKDACNKIKTTGAAGHTRKEWQELKSLNLGAASSLLEGVLKGFMTSEADAKEAVSEKGSDDAKNRMCPCDCDMCFVASATKENLANGNYKITIVMKDENTPKKGSKGIASMSTGILYMEDVSDTVVNDATVSKIVKSLDKGELYYQAYTIVAEMTKDGKFVDINHFAICQLSATATVKLVGQISGDGTLDFHSHWYNFKY